MNDLQGRACVITGASRGFGAALTRAFHAAGADLLLAARGATELQQVVDSLPRREAQRVTYVVADLAESAGIESVAKTARAFDGIDVLVNNAAIQGPIGVLWENDFAEWQRTVAINLFAPVALCRLLVPLMAERGGGSIINLSGGGATAPRENFSAYATSKTALVRFSETLAAEVRALGINVNCLAPGAMDTAMLQAVARAGEAGAGRHELDAIATARRNSTATVQRAAALAVFLASERAASITGKLISAVWDPWEQLSEHSADLAQTDVYTIRRIVPKDRHLGWGEN